MNNNIEEKIKEIMDNHELLRDSNWFFIFVFMVIFCSHKAINLEEFDNLLTKIENGDIDLFRREITKDE